MTGTSSSDQPRTRTAGEDTDFLRVLGNREALALGFGAMIGFGWVVLTGDWLRSAGSAGAVLAFGVGGVVMALVGLVYAELVSAMPRAGGEHNYVLRALGGRWALVGSWAIVGGYISVAAFEAVALPRTLAYLLPWVDSVPLWTVAGAEVYLPWILIGGGAAVGLTWINVRGIKPASLLQTFAVLFLLGILVLLLLGSAVGGERGHLEPFFTGGFGGFVAVLVAVPFMFVGFDVIPQSAEEVHVPPQQTGKLVVVAVVLAALFYMLVMGTVASSMGVDALAGTQLATADALGALWSSDLMANVLIAGGVAGILTSWNAFLIGGSRLLFAMGRSAMLPAWFGRLHPRYRTPANALLFIGGLSVAAPFFGDAMLGWLVDSGSPSIVIAYLLVAVSFLVLRSREPDMERPLRVGGPGAGGTVLGAVAVVLTLGLLLLYVPGMPSGLPVQPYVMFGIWWLLGLLFLLRLPGGVAGGPDAHDRLVAAARRRG